MSHNRGFCHVQTQNKGDFLEESTPYRIALTPWIIVQWISPTQRTVVRRFRNRNDAESHLATPASAHARS